ncbi:MAG: MBOAT family O-acyltransferase [Bacteroidota bacterium]
MLFNSITFAIFFPIVFGLYWFVCYKQLKFQNALLLVASYYFYANWDWRFLFLLIFSTLLDYYTGIKMSDTPNARTRKFWFILSICINLGFLGIFKYYNFFVSSFADGLNVLGIHFNYRTLDVILPIGISFYTFHGLSYVIDIYKKRIPAEKNFIDYALFVSFFPLLVAGPIERATHLLPQLKKARTFSYIKAADGLKQILWGLFKKIVIADQCAKYADLLFNNVGEYSGLSLVMGALFFTFQIYCDFSGYSDIALGTSRLLGIELLRNFAFPYFSRDIAEFWRRWHISLSSWFRDYLYIPLGGSMGSTWTKVRNTFIIFLISGFWHGANWTFIIWGLLNALYIMPSILFSTNRRNIDSVAQGKLFPSLKELFAMMTTFGLTVFAWIFFRAPNIHLALTYIQRMFSQLFDASSLAQAQQLFSLQIGWGLAILLVLFLIIEWMGREYQYALANIGIVWPKAVRWSFYYALIIAIISFSESEQQFIYFQF